MSYNLTVLHRSKIFKGMQKEEIVSAVNCLNGEVKSFQRGDVLFSEGDEANIIGIIISGEVQTVKTDVNGNTNMVARIFPSGLIALAAAFSLQRQLPFDVVASSDCTILFLDSAKLVRPCCNACSFHIKLMENLIYVIAENNLRLTQKIDILTKRNSKAKILAYLLAKSKAARNKTFSIDLTRRQMAEYLSINRSALSRELSKMQDDGIITFEENHFTLLV